ncbi:MAG: hypothetical protein KDD25_03280 [Bdellovibrionales bacterium]|nr:hypothetical protein [Bdellovibrionales bacterium]
MKAVQAIFAFLLLSTLMSGCGKPDGGGTPAGGTAGSEGFVDPDVIEEGAWSLLKLECNSNDDLPVFHSIPSKYESEITITETEAEIFSVIKNLDSSTCQGKFLFKSVVQKPGDPDYALFTVKSAQCTGTCSLKPSFQLPCDLKEDDVVEYKIKKSGKLLMLSDSKSDKAKTICGKENFPAEWTWERFN